MNKIIKIVFLLFLIGFISIELRWQQIDEKKQLVYNLNELKIGEFLHDYMMIGPFPNQLPDGVKEYFHLDKTCLGFATDYDLQNARKIEAKGIVKGLPKDIGVHDWNYIGVYHSDKIKTVNQINFYLDKGYKTRGVAWFEPANVLDILMTGKEHKDLILGIIYTEWVRFGQTLLAVAEANWIGKTILGNFKF